MHIVTVLWLKSLEVFSNVPDGQLQWFIDHSDDQRLGDGEYLTEPGDPIKGPHVLVEGKLSLHMFQNGSKREFVMFTKGDISGYLPYSRGKISGGYAQAIGEVQLLSFRTEKMQEMIKDHFELTQSLVHVMNNRVREFTAMQQQNEKMMALGKLSAGLAHELNNPASAIVRDSISLKEHLRLGPQVFKKVVGITIKEEQIDKLNEVLFRIIGVKEQPLLSLKQRMVLEDEIADWFEEKNVENSYTIAENFVDFNFSVADLEACAEPIAEYLSPVFNWISNLLVTERMVEDIQESSKRIADLVNSVKTFTHMDRGMEKEYADIHIGIRNTLTMLGYKIKKGNITVVEDYDETLPQVKGMIGELNQVWTNLIDNAIDAMEPNLKGTLTLKTEKDREFVNVSIIDDGPGIPADVLSSIFDPFFTTKPMGKGTGMGLEVVQRIIHQHNGNVKVKSVPGRTEFTVCFPLEN
ncbi:signal transduction histidine kinase [Pedobacter cryoconitis]|uniref:histidine kinase n=1 Tax=Pedobacter cryoconitis TaxID=188932 RepID=A0A7W8ZLS6_9SPHI|nr:ATP-binding protein [Pedobacter cryoconitis]MBB5636376.1 signal transduction histidine kinase [Pedobacter cryoconitis]